MTKKQRENHLSTILNTLKAQEWVQDRWFNWKKVIDGREYRVKVQKTSMRYECKAGHSWINLRSDYIKNIKLVAGYVVIKTFILR